MSQEKNLSRFFVGNCFGGGFFFIVLILLLMLGEDLIQWILCNEEVLIWIIILILFFNICDFDFGCC